MTDQSFHTRYEIGFKDGLGFKTKHPVHENLTIASFILSKEFSPDVTYDNLSLQQWEYMRGLLWNDDPSCLLFNDIPDTNHSFGDGVEFGTEYKFGSDKGMTRRSHLFDLQFLHSMAASTAEDPRFTHEKILRWFEVMYKLACGNQGVSKDDQLKDRFTSQMFDDSTTPNRHRRLEELLLATTPGYKAADIPRRALGCCLHMIQDSYAVGHTLRRLINKDDLDTRDKNNFIRFKPGTYAKLGSIITFHTYRGQSDRHMHYDGMKDHMVPKDLDSFNAMIGARMAIEMSSKLADFYLEKRKWEDGVRDWLANTVFAIDEAGRDSDTRVDERFGVDSLSGPHIPFVVDSQDQCDQTSCKSSRPQDVKIRHLVIKGRLATLARCLLIFMASFLLFTFGLVIQHFWFSLQLSGVLISLR